VYESFLGKSINHEALRYAISQLLLYFLPLRPKYLPQNLFSKCLNLHYSINVRDQVSGSYKITDNITLWIL
jgi:hypothetical protein